MKLLDDATADAVYRADAGPYVFADVRRAAQPQLIIVGGQPGCGKSGAVLAASHELRSASAHAGVAVINGDELRAFHPDYKRLVHEDRATAADKTGADVGAWVERAIRDAAANGFNAVIETTMRQPVVVLATARAFKEAGHQVELRVLVVDPEISRQAIYQRFARALERVDSLPRFTLARYHEDALAKMPETLQAIAGVVTLVKLVSRRGTELYASTEARTTPAAVLAQLRRAALPLSEVKRIAGEWTRLRAGLDREGVPDLVRTGVRREQERFAALAMQLDKSPRHHDKQHPPKRDAGRDR